MDERPGANHGFWSVSTKRSASTSSEPCFPRARIRSGIHGALVGMVNWMTVPCPSIRPFSAAAARSNRARAKMAPWEE